MSYPNLLAKGITAQTAFTPFELYAGERDIVSDFVTAGAADLAQFTPYGLDEDGTAVVWSPATGAATGTITLSGVGTAADTVTVDGQAITLVASGAAGFQANIGGTATATAQAIKAVINANPDTFHVAASGAAAVLTLTALDPGTGGNSITLAKSSTAIAVSAATLTGGADQTDAKAAGITAQLIAAGTKGPVFIGGGFNIDAINWPAGLTDAQKKRAFSRTPISVHKLK